MGRDEIKGSPTPILGAEMIINGEFQLELKVIPDSWLLGDGIFETLRTYNNRPFVLDMHLERLTAGIAEIGGAPPDIAAIGEAINELITKVPRESGRIRIIYGTDGNWLISHDEYSAPIGSARCILIEANPAGSSVAKMTSYGPRFALRRRALAAGFDDAIFKDGDGWITEATTCNLIALIDGNWVTPPIVSGCLAGITRRLLLENFGVQERRISAPDLQLAEAVALTSSLREIQGISEIDGKIYGNSNRLTLLKSAFSAWVLGKLQP